MSAKNSKDTGSRDSGTVLGGAIVAVAVIGAVFWAFSPLRTKSSGVSPKSAAAPVSQEAVPTAPASSPTRAPVPTTAPVAPAPTMTARPPTLQVTNESDYREGTRFYVVGEVVNNGTTPMRFTQVIGTFYGEDGKVVTTDSTYTQPDTVGPGERAPFKIIVLSNTSGIRRYSLRADGRA